MAPFLQYDPSVVASIALAPSKSSKGDDMDRIVPMSSDDVSNVLPPEDLDPFHWTFDSNLSSVDAKLEKQLRSIRIVRGLRQDVLWYSSLSFFCKSSTVLSLSLILQRCVGVVDPRAKEDYCVKHWWRFQRPIVAVLQAEACFLKQGNQKREENNDVSDQTLIEAVSTM